MTERTQTYRELLHASPALAAEALKLAREHNYDLHSVAQTILQVRAEAMEAGVQMERERVLAELEAQR